MGAGSVVRSRGFGLALGVALALVLLAVPATSNAAFGAGPFSATRSNANAATHPSITFNYRHLGAATEDVRDIAFELPPGVAFNPEAVPVRCTSGQFIADACPSTSAGGTLTMTLLLDASRSYVGLRGTAYVLEPEGTDHATLGFVVRPLVNMFQKIFIKQSLRLDTSGSGAAAASSLRFTSFPNFLGSTATTLRNLSVRIGARVGTTGAGRYFVTGATGCDAALARLTLTSYADEPASRSVAMTSSGCARVPFAPSAAVSVASSEASHPTGFNAEFGIPTADAPLQNSHVKSVSVDFPSLASIDGAAVTSLGGGCSEAQLQSATCPAASLIGSATVSLPSLPPAMTGEIRALSPIVGAPANVPLAVVVNGARGARVIMRGSLQATAPGVRLRLDDLPQLPFSLSQLSVSKQLLVNPPVCADQSIAIGLSGYSGAAATRSASYTTTDCVADGAPPVVSGVAFTPAGPSTDTTPVVSYSASDPAPSSGIASRVCSIDKGNDGSVDATVDPCPSGTTLPDLDVGANLVTVTVTDFASNAGSSSAAYTVIAAPPDTHITFGPESPVDYGGSDPMLTETDRTPTWSFEALPAAGATFECAVAQFDADGTPFDSPPAAWSSCSSPFTPAADLALGKHTFWVRASGGAGADPTPDHATVEIATISLSIVGNPTDDAGNPNYQANDNANLTIDVSGTAGDPKNITARAPNGVWGSPDAVPHCGVADANAGTCPASSKIGEATITADVNLKPHSDAIPPHRVTRTGELFLADRMRTATAPMGDAATVMFRVHAIDDPAYGGTDFGFFNHPIYLKARYTPNGAGTGNYPRDVLNPRGIDAVMENIPNELTGPGGQVAEVHMRRVTGTIFGNAPHYSRPMIYNGSACNAPNAATNEAVVLGDGTTWQGDTVSVTHPYQVTGCANVPYAPRLTEIKLSTTSNPDDVTPLTPGAPIQSARIVVDVAPGSSTTKRISISMPRSIIASPTGISSPCPKAQTEVPIYPTCSIADHKIGSALIETPLLAAPVVATAFKEVSGGSLPHIYIVGQIPAYGLDVRIRAKSSVTGSENQDYISTTLNTNTSNTLVDIPSMPISKLTMFLTGSATYGPLLEVNSECHPLDSGGATATGYANNAVNHQVLNPPLAFDGCPDDVRILSGPATGAVTSNNDLAFTFTDVLADGSTEYMCALDADPFGPCDDGIGTSGSHTFNDVPDGPHSFIVTSTASGFKDVRVFEVDTVAPSGTTILSGPAAGGTTSDTTPTFKIGSTQQVNDFRCSWDSATVYFPCYAPFYTPDTPLTSGSHTFRVKAFDGAQEDAPVVRSFTVTP